MPRRSSFYLEAAGFVLLGLAAIAFLITEIIHDRVWSRPHSTYHIMATFDNVGDLKPGASVSMAGVEVGRVLSIKLDTTANRASVFIEVDTMFNRIPSDTDASINTQGLLGDKFIRLTSGVSSAYLHESSRILTTHSATSIDSLLHQITGDDRKPARSRTLPGPAPQH
jgi:phospholipid/cholesterol/gamma-HCH transport system substrate-binding protein